MWGHLRSVLSPKSKRCWLLLQHSLTSIQKKLQQWVQMQAAMGLTQFFCKSTQMDCPVAFASRTLTKSKGKYTQMEKECWASTWACEKFDRYNMFSVVTDHKPLVPLINTKDLSETPTPLHCQRMLMHLIGFNVKAKHVPRKDMLVADTLSRSPVSTTESSPMRKFKPMSATSSHHGKCQMQNWPRSEKRLWSALHVPSWYRHLQGQQHQDWRHLKWIHPSACNPDNLCHQKSGAVLILSRPHSEAGSLTQLHLLTSSPVYTWLGSLRHSGRLTTIITTVSREHFIFINAAYTQDYSSAGTVFSVYSHTCSHQIWPHHQ